MKVKRGKCLSWWCDICFITEQVERGMAFFASVTARTGIDLIFGHYLYGCKLFLEKSTEEIPQKTFQVTILSGTQMNEKIKS